MLENKIKTGILGATGTVGQKFISLLAGHPWFDVVCVAASSRSAGQPYGKAVEGRWAQGIPVPEGVARLNVCDAEADFKEICGQVNLVFSALSLDKNQIRDLEVKVASENVAVVSNNSAHRWTEDVPMMMPEVNPHHAALIDTQRKNRGWNKGLIAVKPNCSIQSYVPVLDALKSFGLEKVVVSTYQAISGAGKTLETAPEILDNIIPYIGGEEEKSEQEPMKIWGELRNGKLVLAQKPVISANCVRVPVSDGHLVTVNVAFGSKPTKNQIVEAIRDYKNPIAELKLPSSPEKFLICFEDDNRPQTRLDRDVGNGMSVTAGRFREDNILDWKFVALSHNTVRGAAGGAVLTAELLTSKKYIGD
ncbi:aspartate-semialdehyde dehydrogenase [bacterium]|nr:aspartate-semialdehyde dehydrogenase [bacterium]